MDIEPLNNSTVKVTMTRDDMTKCSLTYSDLSHKTYDAQVFLTGLVTLLRDYNEAKLDTKKIYIEIFAEKEGGCTIFVSAVPEKTSVLVRRSGQSSFSETITIDAKTPDSLLEISQKLIRRFKKDITNSKLFYRNSRYRIILTATRPIESEISDIPYEKGDVAAALTAEHWQCISENNVLDVINEKFSE